MKKFIMLSLLFLSACGPIVKHGDIEKELTKQGYSKIVIMAGSIDCGRFGSGKHFIAHDKMNKTIMGQVCYIKSGGNVKYKISFNRSLDKTVQKIKF